MFIENKYNKIYYSIIANAQARVLEGYTENHHIIPKSLGGNNNKDNLVALTAREHYICHLLLTKFTTGVARNKMLYAIHRITNKSTNIIKSSRIYSYIRTEHAAMLSSTLKGVTIKERFGREFSHPRSDYQKERIRESNRSRVWSIESRAKMSNSKKGHSNNKGILKSDAHKQKLSEARRDKTIYTWNHTIFGTFVGTKYNLADAFPSIKFNLGELGKVTNPNCREKSHRGWFIY